jgi:hypothetical protein
MLLLQALVLQAVVVVLLVLLLLLLLLPPPPLQVPLPILLVCVSRLIAAALLFLILSS